MSGWRTGTPATRSEVTVRSLSVRPYVGTPSNRRSVASRHATTVGQGPVQRGDDDPEPAPGQPGAPQAGLPALHHRAVAPVPLEPHPRLRDPRPVHPAVPGRPRLL